MDTEQIDELIEKLVKFQAYRMGIYDDFEFLSKKSKNLSLRYFERIYPLSNETLSEYFSKLDLKDKKVLTVGSSGDQILYALLNGAKDITLVDINPFAKFYIDLKIAAIKHFNHKDFKKYIDFFLTSNNIIKSALYRKISHLLPEDSRYFWDNIFLDFDKLEGFAHTKKPITDHYIYKKEDYNKLKRILLNEDFNLSFHTMDIKDIATLIKDQKYDAIFLSNIYDYIAKWHNSDEEIDFFSPHQIQFFNVCQSLINSLNPNGTLQVQYGFNSMQRVASKVIFSEILKITKCMT